MALKKPKPKPKPTRKPKSNLVPFDYITRRYMQDTFREQFQPVQQELAQLVEEVRSYQDRTQNIGKSLARIESDLDSLVKHFIPELDPQGLPATHLKQSKTQKVRP